MSVAEVSVLLPVHNAGPGFNAAVLSILHQDHIRAELILVLNHADQTTTALARELAAVFPQIRLIEEPRKGIHFALHTGLFHCSAPFIARMDADDISLPDRLCNQRNVLLHQPDIDLVSCRVILPDSPHNEGFRAFVNWQNNILSPEQHLSHVFHESPVAHPSVMFRSSCIKRWGSYSLDTNIPEDYELWLRWQTQGARFLKLPEPLLIWNDSPGRLSRVHSSYSKEAFDKVRYPFAAAFFGKHKKKWWVCGGSRIAKRKMNALQQHGLEIAGVIDVVPRKISGIPFVRAKDFVPIPGTGVLNLISGREQRAQVATFLSSLNLMEGTDWFTIG
jgi:glycosyltransferase involved in cell wall biosynthesis